MQGEAIVLHGSRTGPWCGSYKGEDLDQYKENHQKPWSSSKEEAGVSAEMQETGADGMQANIIH